jgi:hypothetical protein
MGRQIQITRQSKQRYRARPELDLRTPAAGTCRTDAGSSAGHTERTLVVHFSGLDESRGRGMLCGNRCRCR